MAGLSFGMFLQSDHMKYMPFYKTPEHCPSGPRSKLRIVDGSVDIDD